MTLYNLFMGNLKHAVREGKQTHIGGGLYSPAELRSLVATLTAMETCVQECEPRPDTFDFGPAYEAAVSRREALLKELT